MHTSGYATGTRERDEHGDRPSDPDIGGHSKPDNTALSLSLPRLSSIGSSRELLEVVLLLLLRDLDRAEPSLLASVSRTSLDSAVVIVTRARL